MHTSHCGALAGRLKVARLMVSRLMVAALIFPTLVVGVTTVHAAEPPDYLRDVKPLLAEKCFACHSALKQEGALRLDAIGLIHKGGDSGAIITPGNARESILIQRVSSPDEDLRMPPADAGHPLSKKQIAILQAWVEGGAVAPAEPIPEDPRKHWAFQPPVQPTVPDASAPWVRNEIDRFLAAQHQRLGLVAVGEAPKSLLLRRVYLDLIGLPPTVAQQNMFLEDTSPEAWEKAVERLLESPQYGERWARHFMDIWRYSDPSGYGDEIRDGRKHIWRWRDWIVESLNHDKGYDRMVVEMLAADEAAPDDLDAARATGFLARNWYKFNRNVWLDNIVEHTSKAFLGLTVNCARCHDHKYDPIGHNEYYQMRAFFEPHEVRDDPLSSSESEMLVRTYDAQATTPTYLFLQGDENRPDNDHPLKPDVPEVLAGDLSIQPIDLPVTSYYPAIRPENRKRALAQAEAAIASATSALAKAESVARAAALAVANKKNLATAAVTADGEAPSATTHDDASSTPLSPEDRGWLDDFSKFDPQQWQVESGQWISRAGRLVQSQGETVQHRVVSRTDHPYNFHARLKLRITGGARWRSVGLGFDVQGKAMHAVYLSANTGGPKAQVTLQNAAGSWAYPSPGAVSRDVQLDHDYMLEILVRNRLMNVLIDDQLQVAFTLPERPTSGKLTIFTFSATAEFDDLQVKTLNADTTLVADSTAAESKVAPPRSLTAMMHDAEAAADGARTQLALATAQHRSLAARIEAELVKYGLAEGDAESLGQAAGLAARRATVCDHEHRIAKANLQLAQAAEKPAGDMKVQKAVEQARQELETQTKQLAAARQQIENGSAEYPPLGPIHPATSTGRRLGLARWMVDRQNPLSARVLVNHVWLRHFDAPLVERMFDFGLRSARPQHAALMDWLAVQFMNDGWSLKSLHRRIVLSGIYRLSSAPPPAVAASETESANHSNLKIDPDNHALWRMNARRMEAEVARDSLLFLGGSLDTTMGGPPISHTEGQTVLRRSLYFRQDKERQMTFLSLFDGAKVNECYQRKATVAPQQALAMFNSQIAWEQAGKLASQRTGDDDEAFVAGLFGQILCRPASIEETEACRAFLADADNVTVARRQLALVLLNHNDFVTIR